MMKQIKTYLLVTTMLLFVVSCSENDNINKDETVVKIDEVTENKLDKFLYKEYVKPYNIAFNYKLKDIDSNMSYNIVPAYYENSIRMANLFKYLCLDVYSKVVSKEFVQKLFPKKIVLVGSAAYNTNSTRVLGAAEGGVEITLYAINELNQHLSNKTKLNSLYFHTIHHEFAHILHQTTDFTTDYDNISKSEYVGDDWNRAWHWHYNPSVKRGFVTDYASKDENEDFVEMFSKYITNTSSQWEALLNKGGEEGKQILLKKENIMRKYFKDTWKIDIDVLRDEIQTRINNLSNVYLDKID